MGTGDDGAFLQIIDFTDGIGNPEEIYYYDNSEGGTGDSTPDTGDGVSYGDVGLKLTNIAPEGTYMLKMQSYVLPANTQTSIVDTLLYQFNVPLIYHVNQQEYSSSSVNIAHAYNLPSKTQLYQNYPNPFNPNTSIQFDLADEGYIELDVYNSFGQLISKLLNQNMKAGHYSIKWDGTDSSGKSIKSGIYFYKLRINSDKGDKTEVKRCVLLK